MRRANSKKGIIVVLVVCAIIVLFVAGLYASNNQIPSPDGDTMAAEPVLQEQENLPTQNTNPPEIEPMAVVSRQFIAEFSDFIEPDFVKNLEINIASLPVRMRIPALSVDYEIWGLGADATGTMMIVPELDITTWFDLSSIPGNKGNAILGGHNIWGGVRSGLYTLDELEIGDEMEIEYDDGSTMLFLMESVFVYPLATSPAHLIMDVRGDARVTLITCKGPFNASTGTSDYRIVATFKHEYKFVTPNPPIEKFPLNVIG